MAEPRCSTRSTKSVRSRRSVGPKAATRTISRPHSTGRSGRPSWQYVSQSRATTRIGSRRLADDPASRRRMGTSWTEEARSTGPLQPAVQTRPQAATDRVDNPITAILCGMSDMVAESCPRVRSCPVAQGRVHSIIAARWDGPGLAGVRRCAGAPRLVAGPCGGRCGAGSCWSAHSGRPVAFRPPLPTRSRSPAQTRCRGSGVSSEPAKRTTLRLCPCWLTAWRTRTKRSGFMPSSLWKRSSGRDTGTTTGPTSRSAAKPSNAGGTT